MPGRIRCDQEVTGRWDGWNSGFGGALSFHARDLAFIFWAAKDALRTSHTFWPLIYWVGPKVHSGFSVGCYGLWGQSIERLIQCVKGRLGKQAIKKQEELVESWSHLVGERMEAWQGAGREGCGGHGWTDQMQGEGAGVGLEMNPGFPASELIEVSKKQTKSVEAGPVGGTLKAFSCLQVSSSRASRAGLQA